MNGLSEIYFQRIILHTLKYSPALCWYSTLAYYAFLAYKNKITSNFLNYKKRSEHTMLIEHTDVTKHFNRTTKAAVQIIEGHKFPTLCSEYSTLDTY